MAAQVFSFVHRRQISRDWSRDELAELYRIEGALVKSGLTLEVDRGISDEGDPWFVFCRTDGEVLIHLTRYDGLYRLHSPALPAPLVGRTFADLTKSFADQIPLQIPVQRDRGAKLYVHPASMLAIIIGTIIVASHDILSPQVNALEKSSADGSDLISEHNLKSLLQSIFQGYLDNFLGWLRDGTTGFEQSAYFNIISTIAAFVVGSTAILDKYGHDIWTEVAQVIASDHVPETDNALLAQVQHGTTSDAATGNASGQTATSGDFSQDHSPNGDAHYVQSIEHKPEPIVSAPSAQQSATVAENYSEQVKGADHFLASVDSIISDQLVSLNQLVTDNTRFYVDPTVHPSGIVSDAGASDPLQDLLTSLSNLGQNLSAVSSSEVSSLISHATYVSPSVEGSQNLLSYFVAQNQIATNLQTSVLEQSISTTSPATTTPPMFDANAAATLVAFLKANPNSEAVFDNNSVVVYDGLSGAQAGPVTIQTWEFSDGSTITLVGHASHSLVA